MPEGFHISLAVICEQVLREDDGVLSLIRLVDQIRAAPGKPAGIQLALVLGLCFPQKDHGKIALNVEFVSPSGEVIHTRKVDVVYSGKEVGAGVVKINLVLSLQDRGLYWFNVSGPDGEVVVRVPLRVSDQAVKATTE